MDTQRNIRFELQVPNGQWVEINPDFGDLAHHGMSNIEDLSPDTQIDFLSEHYEVRIRVTITMVAVSELGKPTIY